jgi:hypothetical protein
VTSRLVALLESNDESARHRSLDEAIAGLAPAELSRECAALDEWRRSADNLYQRVRALFFLHAIHRYARPWDEAAPRGGRDGRARAVLPDRAVLLLRDRRFTEAIDRFLAAQRERGPSEALSSALAAAYRALGFQTLADQVRRSVRSIAGNRWMFRCGHPLDQPLRVRRELLERETGDGAGAFPLLRERTPVRMDLSHSGWSDIFFLGMDFPEGARVLNVSIDLAVRGRDERPQPPVEAWLRVIDEPLLRLTSVDLEATADVSELTELFDFARDHLGLLKAAVLASGLVPPAMEGSGTSLVELLARMIGPGMGVELVSHVRAIPKGSRLAVSTTLLASLVSVAMRATGQVAALEGPLSEDERRTVAARAILGEWLGGSGGGWQDSGGLWPGIKLIEGVVAREGDAEHGVSRGRLLPKHTPIEVPPDARDALQRSLVLVHGGMAQNVGPILEMVTEKHLLRGATEWKARQESLALMDELVAALRGGDVAALARATTRNFFGPLQAIIPQASNAFTEAAIERVRARFGADFLGFWMLGGASGGGMGFVFRPPARAAAMDAMAGILGETKRELESALPFAMEPVVYDFEIDDVGTRGDLVRAQPSSPGSGLLPAGYYARIVPELLRRDPARLTRTRRRELERYGEACRAGGEFAGGMPALFDRLLPQVRAKSGGGASLAELLERSGFDREWHEHLRRDLLGGRLGLAQNRLPASTTIEDARDGDVIDVSKAGDDASAAAKAARARGEAALAAGEVAVVTLAAGAASRWSGGAGIVKALSPFWKAGGRHRSFLDVHLAKSRRLARICGKPLPHVLTTSVFTHEPIEAHLRGRGLLEPRGTNGSGVELHLSPGRAVGLRTIPTERDLRFAWEETSQQRLDEQAQKVREGLRAALIAWARAAGEASDYVDNVPSQCIHPVGHWHEVPNLLRNGVLARLLAERPKLSTLLLHNVDTVGADADPALLGVHLEQVERGAALTFEVIARQLEDRGGGLARVDGRLRLVEGLALPREEIELELRCYNTMSSWIDVDGLLRAFGLARTDLDDADKVAAAIRRLASRLPTYVTLKDVKKRWGHGQEDVFPVAQTEKLWSDMTALPDLACRFLLVPRARGQQLKEISQLDGWLRDGSADYVASRCEW